MHFRSAAEMAHAQEEYIRDLRWKLAKSSALPTWAFTLVCETHTSSDFRGWKWVSDIFTGATPSDATSHCLLYKTYAYKGIYLQHGCVENACVFMHNLDDAHWYVQTLVGIEQNMI